MSDKFIITSMKPHSLEISLGDYKVGDVLKLCYNNSECEVKITAKIRRSVVLGRFKKWLKSVGLDDVIIR